MYYTDDEINENYDYLMSKIIIATEIPVEFPDFYD